MLQEHIMYRIVASIKKYYTQDTVRLDFVPFVEVFVFSVSLFLFFVPTNLPRHGQKGGDLGGSL